MSEKETAGLEEEVIKIYRVGHMEKGGRRLRYTAMVVVGDKNGTVGLGYGKANQVPAAVEKAVKIARKSAVKVARHGNTIPHQIMARYEASKVLLKPASSGTGVIAGPAVRAVLEAAGIKDILSKSFGTNNAKNLAKATWEGLKSLRSKEEVEGLRGVKLQ
ncbi:MAG: 30S ribosomal protein S5 [Planctomycetes bacterium DG_23]|nr:MAG: 30S ribosomal protein S5 [Planctomycetes bacterium DG_23]